MITNRPAPWWLRELAHGRASYEELLGWPVTVQVGTRTLALPGTGIAAVTMPAALGAAVRHELGVALQCPPVVTDPEGLLWTFLTGPPVALRPGVAAQLAGARVTVAARDSSVTIPTLPTRTSPTTPAGRLNTRAWRWVEPPVRTLPPAYPVIAVIRRLTERTLAMGA